MKHGNVQILDIQWFSYSFHDNLQAHVGLQVINIPRFWIYVGLEEDFFAMHCPAALYGGFFVLQEYDFTINDAFFSILTLISNGASKQFSVGWVHTVFLNDTYYGFTNTAKEKCWLQKKITLHVGRDKIGVLASRLVQFQNF